MNKKVWIVWLLVLLLVWTLPVSAAATATGTQDSWVIVEYQVDQTRIQKGDEVYLSVLLQNSDASFGRKPAIVPVVSSFNGVEDIDLSEYFDDNYIQVSFDGAEYLGVGKDFVFRVDGQELSLTVHECEEYVEPTPEEPPVDQTEPVLMVGRADQEGPIAAGQQQVIGLWVQNLSEEWLEEVVATVTPSSGLMIADNSVTYPLYPLHGESESFFYVTVRGMDQISSEAQSLEINLQYTYYKNGAAVQGSASHTVPLTATVTQQIDSQPMASSVPNLIVSGYDYGNEKIYAGNAFDLSLTFRNTSAIKRVENIVMTIEPGTELAITSSANSFHFPSLDPGQEQTQLINLQALPDAQTAPTAISVRFSYEYIDVNTRHTVTAEQSVSLPVYQLDRFELTQENAYVDAWQFEESFLTLNYVNKGKNTVYNVSAELVGDMAAMSRVQNVGNVESGKSGTIDFIITPEMPGENSCTLVITYEDSAMQVMTKEFTFDVFVNEMYVPEIMPEEDPMIYEEPEPERPVWLIPAIAAGGLLVVVLVIVLIVRKKKKSDRVDTFVFSDGTEE